MPQPVELKGRAASGGIFIGPLKRVAAPGRPRRRTSSPLSERAALQSAIGAAIADIAGLTEKIEGEGGEMLAFQIAMLEDDALTAPAFAALIVNAKSSKTSSEGAWI